MKYEEKEIKKGIKLHEIKTDKFKTNLIAIFLSMPITKENVTKNSLISAVLRRGSKNMPTQEKISQELEEMYGATFNCGLDKTGDNHILKFYLESVNDNFLPQTDENMLKTSCYKLLEIVFNPLVENESFKEEYIKQEKENVKRIIEGKPDNKARYAFDRCIEEMYKDKPYGLYKYGYIEDLEKITAKDLYEYYQKMISECKIDIFVFDRFAIRKPFYIIITAGVICVIIDIGAAVDPACAESFDFGEAGNRSIDALCCHFDFADRAVFVESDRLNAAAAAEITVVGRSVIENIPFSVKFGDAAVVIPCLRIAADVVNDDAALCVRTKRMFARCVA